MMNVFDDSDDFPYTNGRVVDKLMEEEEEEFETTAKSLTKSLTGSLRISNNDKFKDEDDNEEEDEVDDDEEEKEKQKKPMMMGRKISGGISFKSVKKNSNSNSNASAKFDSSPESSRTNSSSSDEANDDEENFRISPLTANIGTSYVDPNNLISLMASENAANIGMKNFKSKKVDKIQEKIIKSQLHLSAMAKQSLIRQRWRQAAIKARQLNDPWCDFKVDQYETEEVVRHRYNAIKKAWIQDECVVKIEPKQFANGAMRACFRLKKLSHFVHTQSWEHASNYVAKSYMDKNIPRQRYFDDVKLQMEAKLWAEIYNRHNPPKKIDMFQVSILEFKNRTDSPLFHLEHYLDGKYVKYNSNSGFVEDEHLRYTPQAFSHFTFECSNHELMVVDIQGVGDLYTDPQIHTANGKDYGDGNLGTKGFALFFYSHICNDVCKSLGLTQFDLAATELKNHEKIVSHMHRFSLTLCRGSEEPVVGSPTAFGDYLRLRNRYRSETSTCSDENNNHHDIREVDESEGYESSSPSPLSPNFINHGVINPFRIHHNNSNNNLNGSNGNLTQPMRIPSRSRKNSTSQLQQQQQQDGNHHSPPKAGVRRCRFRTESSCLDSAFSIDEAKNYFENIEKLKKPRASCVFAEKDFILNQLKSRAQQRGSAANHEEEEDDDEDDDYDESELIGRQVIDDDTSDEDDDEQSNEKKKNEEEEEDDDDDAVDKRSEASSTHLNMIDDKEESTLGKIHLELVKYHEMGRFNLSEEDPIDQEAALFHLKQAASLGIVEALTNLAKIYLDLPHDILSSYSLEESDENREIAFGYLVEAAKKDDKSSLFQIAKAFDTGINLSQSRTINWQKAVEYYERLLSLNEKHDEDEDDENGDDDGDSSPSDSDLGYSEISDVDPDYLIMARLAEIYQRGGNGIEPNVSRAIAYYNRAAENAMLFAKGRLANKYYMLVEELSSEMD